ncbi:RHS repeat-associated core domain-containing protein, partial [Desulfosporosinus sp.]|uniref:RHS repeat-associated core domain-containing protein n=1 Tax=Desulfosporosinus sp. TaxID=157907 RepID=UPI0025C17036
ADQLVSVTKQGESTPFVTYQYNEDGKRIQKNVNGTITNYFYDGDSLNVLYETDGQNNVVRSYTYSENGQLLSMRKGTQTYFYHYNAHGDVIAITDQNGQKVASYEYDSWGNVLKAEEAEQVKDNPYRYAGYQFDRETGLYYLIARYYQPKQGVFLSMDPDPGDSDDILTQNGYAYGNNNPVMRVDPDGNYVWMVINAGFAVYDAYGGYKVAVFVKNVVVFTSNYFFKKILPRFACWPLHKRLDLSNQPFMKREKLAPLTLVVYLSSSSSFIGFNATDLWADQSLVERDQRSGRLDFASS